MKKLTILIMVLLVALLSSCSDKASKLQEEAELAMPQLFKDVAKDPNSVKIEKQNIVFSNDSLCIIHFVLTAKNGLGMDTTEKMEYIYLQTGEEKYEAYQTLNQDSVYLNPKAFEKKKAGTIYEKLSYEDALYYRAAIFTNFEGRFVGDKSGEEINIPIPTGTGLWQLGSYIDDFGDETSNKYLQIAGKGVFSNSAATNEAMTAYLIVDRSNVYFRFIEYNSHIVKSEEECEMKIKDSYGDVHEITFTNTKDGQMSTYSNVEVKEILKKGGTITVSAEMGEYLKRKYLFKMDVSGYDKAYEFISPLNDPLTVEYKEKNDAFMKDNGEKEGVVTLPSGVQYKVIKEGSGDKPGERSLIKVHYEGKLIDGKVFDSSYKRGAPSVFRVSDAINGWAEALQQMPVGSIWETYIPYKLGYDDNEVHGIPPFSTLIFKIELLSIEE